MSGWKDEQETIEPVLHLAMERAGSQGAYVYRFGEPAEGALAAFAGAIPYSGDIDGISASAAVRHSNRTDPIVLQQGAWRDSRFEDLPEFQTHRFEGVISIPLIVSTATIGMVNYCHFTLGPPASFELTWLFELNASLVALLRAPDLREELERTAERLAARKILERAKGLLQATRGWTEEEAYSHIRRISRQTRVPMRNVAERLLRSPRHRMEAST